VLPPAFTITGLSSSAQTINISPAIPTGYQCYLRATRSLSPGVKPSSSDFTTIDYFSSSTTGSQTVTTQYTSRFGAPTTGNMVWFEMVLLSLVNSTKTLPFILGQIVT
jgi:hypothetical protein